jgi:hypothetical protein
MAEPLHEVVETPAYLSAADEAGLSEEDRAAIVDALAANPKLGELIVGTGGARKFRWAGRGKGKSGGYRIISYFGGEDVPVFLLSAFSKGERSNLSAADKAELKKELATLADTYRRLARGRG